MIRRLAPQEARGRTLWVVLLAALCAASAFVALERADAAAGGLSPRVTELSEMVPGAHVSHVAQVAPATRPVSLVRNLVPVAIALIALGLAFSRMSEGHRWVRAGRWVRRRGPPLAL